MQEAGNNRILEGRNFKSGHIFIKHNSTSVFSLVLGILAVSSPSLSPVIRNGFKVARKYIFHAKLILLNHFRPQRPLPLCEGPMRTGLSFENSNAPTKRDRRVKNARKIIMERSKRKEDSSGTLKTWASFLEFSGWETNPGWGWVKRWGGLVKRLGKGGVDEG